MFEDDLQTGQLIQDDDLSIFSQTLKEEEPALEEETPQEHLSQGTLVKQELVKLLDQEEELPEEETPVNTMPIRRGGWQDFWNLYEAGHDLAYLDSTEKAVKDAAALKLAEQRDHTMFEPNEAFAYAKEQGVTNLRFDKPVSKASVDFSIMKERSRKELTEKVALYQETGDYSALQQAMGMWSFLSGSVGFAELAATAGLSVVGGVGLAKGLAATAGLVSKGSSIYKGVNLARKAIVAERLAQTQMNAAKAIHTANVYGKTHEALKGADFATKAAFDAYRFGAGAMGKHASAVTTAMPFAMDGLISEIPATMIKSYDSEIKGNDDFGTKEALTNLMIATGVGGALPVVGSLAKAVPGTVSKAVGMVADKFTAKQRAAAMESMAKGYQTVLDAAEKEGKTVQQGLQDILTIAKADNKLAPQYVEAINQIQGANLTEEEMVTKLSLVIDCMKNGKPISEIDNLPFKTEYMTSVPGMYDTVQAMAVGEANADEFVKFLSERGFKLTANKEIVRKETDVETFTAALKEGKFGVGYKVAGETKALGKYYANGLYSNEAQDFLYKCHLANLAKDTVAGQRAVNEAQEYINHLLTLQKKLQEIADTYDFIVEANKAARGTGKIPYPLAKQNIYKTAEKEDATLKEALEEAVYLMLPQSERQAFEEAQMLRKQMDMSMMETGLPGDVSQMDILSTKMHIDTTKEHIDEIVDHLAGWQKSIAETKRGQRAYTYFNLKNNIEGSKSQTAFIRKMADDLDVMVRDNETLLHSEDEFFSSLEPIDQVLKRVEGGGELTQELFAPEVNAVKMYDIAHNNEDSMARLATARADFAQYEGTDVMNSVSEIASIMERQEDNSQRFVTGYLLSIQRGIQATDSVLNMDANAVKKAIVDLLQSDDFFKAMAKKQEKFYPDTLAALIKEERGKFRAILSEAITSSIKDSLPKGALGTKVEEMLDDVADDFFDYLKKNPTEGIKRAIQKPAVDLSKDSKEDAERIVKELTAQQELFDSLLDPLMEKIAGATADLQTQLYHTQVRTMELWKDCLATPGKMSERILGDITMTWLPTKNSGASLENLSDFTVEYQQFLKAIDKIDKNEKGFEGLRDWMFDPANQEAIRDAIVDRWAMINKQLSEADMKRFKPNTREGRIAEAYCEAAANVQKLLYNVGSGKKNIVNFCDPTKLRKGKYFLTRNCLSSTLYKNLSNLMEGTDTQLGSVRLALARFMPRSNSKEDLANANYALYRLEQLDLDKHFNRNGRSKVSLNELRDALLEGDLPGQGDAWARLLRKYNQTDLAMAGKMLDEGFFGIPHQKLGLLDRLEQEGSSISADQASHSAKYLDDMKDKLHYKSLDAMREDAKYFGYDNMKSWFESNIGGAKKAYALINKAGTEPVQFYNNIKEMARTYAHDIAPKHIGVEKAKGLQNSLSGSFERSLNFNINNVCGTYSVPATKGIVLARTIVRLISTPMLMKAGLRSLTDYAYQYQNLVTMGLASATDIGARARVVGKLVNALKSKEIAQSVYMSHALKSDSISKILFNAPMASAPLDAGALKKGASGLNEFAPAYLKVEQFSKDYADVLLNKMAWIGPLTDFNRSNAAITIMQSMGDFASHSWDDIAKIPDKRLITTLERYGISQYEWDNIFTKDAVMSLNDYIKRFNPNDVGQLGEGNMFFPDLLADLTDEQVTKHMQAQNMRVAPDTVARYRQYLTDKASMFVNTGADEMTSIPTSRIQGAMYGGLDPNSWAGFAAGTLMQFQTFGGAVTYYHIGRRLASHMDPADPLYNKVLMCSTGGWATMGDVMGMISELALVQYMLNDAISALSGNYQAIHKDDGTLNGEAIATKTIKAITGPLGLLGTGLDAVFSGMQGGFGTGGGVAISAAPSVSKVIGVARGYKDALTSEGAEGQRIKALGGVTVDTLAGTTGLNNYAFTQPIYGFFIGDKVKEWVKGNNYNDYVRRRERSGYQPSWFEMIMDHFTN